MTSPPNPRPLGDVVRDALSEAGFSLRLASEVTGITLPTLNRRCHTGDFRVSELQLIGTLVDVAPSVLLAESESMRAAA